MIHRPLSGLLMAAMALVQLAAYAEAPDASKPPAQAPTATAAAPASATVTPAAATATVPAAAPKGAAGAKAAPPGGASRGAASTAARPRAADRIDLDASQITGNRELPKVLYIVPWKRPELGDLLGKPVNSLLDEVLAPVDRDVFRRENRYFEALQPAGRQAAEPKATPGDGPSPPPAAKPEN